MDLDDVLEDLLEGARRAMRDRGGRGHRGRRGRGGTGFEDLVGDLPGTVRRWAPAAAVATGLGWFVVLGLVAVGVLAVVGGGIGVAAAVALGILAVLGLPLAGWGAVDLRRRARADRRRSHRARASQQDGQSLDDLPPAIRHDWRRLEQARALVGELADDGWVSPEAIAELDDTMARLRRALEVERRTTELGGRSSVRLTQQVADLADLLVALADEAVEHQADVLAGSAAPATLAQARERMAALRAARREVDGIDRAGGAHGTTSTG